MKLRIACLSAEGSNNAFYRSAAPMLGLQAHGHEVVRLPTDPQRLVQVSLRGFDVLHVHRFADAHVQRLMADAKGSGAVVVWDDDDDVSGLARGTVAYRKWGGARWQARRTAMRRVFSHADLVTAPSAYLAERFATEGARRTIALENYVPADFVRRGSRPHEGIVIGWTAGLEHQVDAERLRLRDLFERLLQSRPAVRVHTIGLGLGVQSDRCTNVPSVPLLRLTDEVMSFDVAIAPIAELGFNHARSNVKVREYAAAGVPWLASLRGSYVGLGEKQGGRLVEDRDWFNALCRLVDNDRERRRLGKRALKWAERDTLERNVAQFEALLTDLVSTRSVVA